MVHLLKHKTRVYQMTRKSTYSLIFSSLTQQKSVLFSANFGHLVNKNESFTSKKCCEVCSRALSVALRPESRESWEFEHSVLPLLLTSAFSCCVTDGPIRGIDRQALPLALALGCHVKKKKAIRNNTQCQLQNTSQSCCRFSVWQAS